MPYPGTRINQETIPLTGANGMTGSASYYEVKFSDPTKPNGQIWTGVVGAPRRSARNAGPPQRWFVVWLGTSNDPVDKGAAKALAESIQPWTAPPAPPAREPRTGSRERPLTALRPRRLRHRARRPRRAVTSHVPRDADDADPARRPDAPAIVKRPASQFGTRYNVPKGGIPRSRSSS